MSDYVLPTGIDGEDVCTPCKAGWHAECEHAFDARLEAANAALRNGLQVDDDMLTLSVPDSVSDQGEPALA